MSGIGDKDNNYTWDDEVLVKSYEKSLNFSREELARRIAARTNTNTNTNTSRLEEMPEQIQEKEKAADAGNADDNISVHKDNENPTIYKVGDYTRATYDVDGIDYEATITAIDDVKGTCCLRYIGYENEQVVNLSGLVPSWGEEARRLQLVDAKRCENVPADDVAKNDGGGADKMPPTATFDYQNERKKHKISKKAKQQQPQQQQQQEQQHHKTTVPNMENFGMLGMSTPPPPLPPIFHDNIPDNSEHLSAMLMSWYMSGYYTGIYQGIQMAAKKKQQQQHKDKLNK